MSANARGLCFLGAFVVAPFLVLIGLATDSMTLTVALPLAVVVGAGLVAMRGVKPIGGSPARTAAAPAEDAATPAGPDAGTTVRHA